MLLRQRARPGPRVVVQTRNQVFQLAKAQNVLQIFAKWELADDEWRKLGHPRETRENYNSIRVPSPANLILTWGGGFNLLE